MTQKRARRGKGDATPFAAAKRAFTATGALELEPIAGLGFRPVAVIAWWTRQNGHGSGRGNCGGMGFWTAEESASVAWVSEDAQRSARTGRIADTAALLGLGDSSGEAAMRAQIESFDPDGLTLRWTARPSEPWVVHFLALGGASLTDVRIGEIPSSTTAAHVDLGLGEMRPDLLLLVPAEGSTIGIGATSGRGRAAAGYSALHGGVPGAVTGAQRSDAAIVGLDAQSGRTCYLALEGIRAKVGTGSSPTRPGTRRTKVGFRPDALLLFSWGLAASPQPKGIGRLCLGAVSDGESGCVSWDDRNVEAPETATHVLSSDEYALVVTDTRTGGVHARAKLMSVDGRGFTLDWTESDGVSRQFAYVALTGRESSGPLGQLARAFRRS